MRSRTGRRIREHYIEVVHCEVGKQMVRPIFTADDAQGRLQSEGRLQNPVRNQLGQHVGNAHRQAQRPSRRTVLHGVREFPAQCENGVGIPHRNATHVGQHQPAAAPAKQLFAQAVLQLADLVADSGSGQAKLFAGGSHAAGARHRPEIQQVMIVQPFHSNCILPSKNLRMRPKLSHFLTFA